MIVSTETKAASLFLRTERVLAHPLTRSSFYGALKLLIGIDLVVFHTIFLGGRDGDLLVASYIASQLLTNVKRLGTFNINRTRVNPARDLREKVFASN